MFVNTKINEIKFLLDFIYISYALNEEFSIRAAGRRATLIGNCVVEAAGSHEPGDDMRRVRCFSAHNALVWSSDQERDEETG